MDHLVGRGRSTPLRVVVAVVAALAVLGLVRLVSGGPDRAPPARSDPTGAGDTPAASGPGPAAPLPAATVRLPAGGCGAVDALRLADLAVSPHPASRPADPLADLEISACGPRGAVLVTPDGDALLSSADVADDADGTACAEALWEEPVPVLRIGAGATFCAVQRAGTASRSGGQVLARLTVTRFDAQGITLAVVRWTA